MYQSRYERYFRSLTVLCSMIRDAEFFKSRISKLEGAADLGDSIMNIVNSKTVAEKPKPSGTPAAATEAASEKPQVDDEKT